MNIISIKNARGGVLLHVWRFIHHCLGVRLGFTIPPNTCGKGLRLNHYGCIVINKFARLGERCTIVSGVVIGRDDAPDKVPTIGNDVFIGANAVLFGKITIADGIAIGAGAVVNRSFLEPHVSIAGNPAKVIGARLRSDNRTKIG